MTTQKLHRPTGSLRGEIAEVHRDTLDEWQEVFSTLQKHQISTAAELDSVLSIHGDTTARWRKPIEGAAHLEAEMSAKRLSPHSMAKARETFETAGPDAARLFLDGCPGMATTPVGAEDRGEPQATHAGQPPNASPRPAPPAYGAPGSTAGKTYGQSSNMERATFGTTHGRAAYDAWKAAG